MGEEVIYIYICRYEDIFYILIMILRKRKERENMILRVVVIMILRKMMNMKKWVKR